MPSPSSAPWQQLSLPILMPTVSRLKSNKFPGLLLVGGEITRSTAEVWAPHPHNISCLLPSLPEDMKYPTVNWLPTSASALLCHQFGCTRLNGSGFEKGPSTLQQWSFHTSSVTSRGLLLVGGLYTPYSTELLPAGGDGVESFPLQHRRYMHCSIALAPGTIILSGGHVPSGKIVTKYSGLDTGEIVTTEMPSLNHGRYSHACGSYMRGDIQVALRSPPHLSHAPQMILVAGGGGEQSTEVLALPDGKWREVEDLPSREQGLRGASLNGIRGG